MSRRASSGVPDGFTLVEVMVAIAVMTVGAIAIFSMQNVTATASRRARIVSTATEVNRFWMERVKLEALRWGPVPHNDPSMAWLNALPPDGTGSSDWFLPQGRGTGDSLVAAASDWWGRPIPVPTAAQPPAPYCTSLRWTWMSTGADEVARLDVRTWWHREFKFSEVERPIVRACGPDQLALTGQLANIDAFGVVYSSTVVRWQGLTNP